MSLLNQQLHALHMRYEKIAKFVEHIECTWSDQVRIYSMLFHLVAKLTTLRWVIDDANGGGGTGSVFGNDIGIMG